MVTINIRIKFLLGKIRIDDLFDGKLYTMFTEQSRVFIPGFIQTKNNVDYLYTFTSRDYLIAIWDLNNKNCFKRISTKINYRRIITGNINYCLMLSTKSIDVLDLNIFKIVQSFKKKVFQDTKENNIYKLAENNGKEYLINVEKASDMGLIIKLIDY